MTHTHMKAALQPRGKVLHEPLDRPKATLEAVSQEGAGVGDALLVARSRDGPLSLNHILNIVTLAVSPNGHPTFFDAIQWHTLQELFPPYDGGHIGLRGVEFNSYGTKPRHW